MVDSVTPITDSWFKKIWISFLPVLKNWWVWVILTLALLLTLSECRNTSIRTKWQKSIEAEIKKQNEQVVKDQKEALKKYEADLKSIQNRLKTLDKAAKVVDNKISKTGEDLEKVKKEKLSGSDIDNRLDELFRKRSGMGTPRPEPNGPF